MRFMGRIFGFIIGGFLTSGLVGAIFGALAGYFLFDYRIIGKNKRTDYDESENHYYDNIDSFNNILKLCFSLINIKGNILISEISAIKYFFKNEFKFNKSEVKEIDKIIYSLGKDNQKIDIAKTISGLNNYCKYNEKITIVQLLFFLAISDKRITNEETTFIFDATQKLNIQSSDYNKIKNLFIVDEENFYNILKVEENATNFEIKQAYRKLVNIYHPDKPHSENYQYRDNFEKIVKAYKELKKIRKF